MNRRVAFGVLLQAIDERFQLEMQDIADLEESGSVPHDQADVGRAAAVEARLDAMEALSVVMAPAGHVLTRAEVVNGTGFARAARFIHVEDE